jgi:3-deoxy-7-phosphoheptulonate synthase
MPEKTQDLRISASRPLLSPAILEEELPLPAEAAAFVRRSRREIEQILTGEDDRLLAIVGPCSVHDPDAALEYARRLRPLADELGRDLMVVMRVYFEKPRTVVGWKGLINDPKLDGSFQINAGLRLARRLLLDVLAAGLPTATEFLDTTLGQYYADTICWGAIGARTTESQVHRELASGLSMPVGFKNRTDGDVQVAVDAIVSAGHQHWFPSLTHEGAPAVLGTSGNAFCHLVLRGGSRTGPNFDAASVAAAAGLLQKAGRRPAILLDCSHANSGKQAERQIDVAADVAGQIAGGCRQIIGCMIESNLVGGSQILQPGTPPVYGQSITDACLPLEDTAPVLRSLAAATRRRRNGHGQ